MNRREHPRGKEGGLALIITVGLLTLLAVAGSVFVRFSIGLRVRTGVELDRTQARLLARSGLQYATARLLQTMEVPKAPTAENQADDWTYRDGAGFPLEKSLNPSYSEAEPYQDVVPNGKYDEGGDPYTDLDHSGRFDSWSGRLRCRHGMTGGTFALKVLGESGQINVNGGWLDTENRNGVDGDTVPDHRDEREIRNRRYVLLLDNLGQIVNVSTAKASQNGAGSRLGDLIKGRPKGGFQSMGQVRGKLSPSDWEKVKDFLTVTEVERAKFSVSDRTGMAGSSGFIRRLGTEARPLVNLGLASRETLQALTLGLALGSVNPYPIDPDLALKTSDYLSQRRFTSWHDFYLQLHRDALSIDPRSAAEEAAAALGGNSSITGTVGPTVKSWAHVVSGNFIADEPGGYGHQDPDLPQAGFQGYVLDPYDGYPPMSWHTYDAPRAAPYPDYPHFRYIRKMGPCESLLGTSGIISRFEGNRPPLPAASNQQGRYLGGTLEASLIPRETAAVSVDCLGRSRTAGGRPLASATASALVRFGAVVSARTQEEFENLSGFTDLGRCKAIGRPFKDRMQSEPQFSVDSMPDLEAQLPADRSRYSPFWGTIRLADRSGYREGERFYVPAWDVDQPLRPSSVPAGFEGSFQDVSRSTDFVYEWNIAAPSVPPDWPLTRVEAAFRGDRAVSQQCAAAPGVSAPGTYTWHEDRKFPLDDGNGNVNRGTIELWTSGRPGGIYRNLGLYWTHSIYSNPPADLSIRGGGIIAGSAGITVAFPFQTGSLTSTLGRSPASRPLVYGDWHHLVAVLDAASDPAMVGYVDGVRDPFLTNDDWASSAMDTIHPPQWFVAQMTLNSISTGYVRGIRGGGLGTEADELRLYDRTLDQGEAVARALSSRYWAGEHFPPSDWPQAAADHLAAVPSFASPLYVFEHPVAPGGARWDGFVPQLIREAVDGGASSGVAPMRVEILCYSDPAGEGEPKVVPFPQEFWRTGGGWADFNQPMPRFRAFRYKVWMDCSAIDGFNGETPVFDSISMAFKTGARLLDAREE